MTEKDPKLPDAAAGYRGDEARPGTPGAGERICLECQGTGRCVEGECRNCGGIAKGLRGIGGG